MNSHSVLFTWGLLVILSLVIACPSAAYTLANPNASPATVELFNYLSAQYGQHCLTGMNDCPNGLLGSGVLTPGYDGDVFTTSGKHEALVDNELSWENAVTPTSTMTAMVNAYQSTRPILAFQWCWYFEGHPYGAAGAVNVANMVIPGTQENSDCLANLAQVANDFQVLQNANIPVLFRPLHEIDSGWFWWTDSNSPANTVALWKMIYNYMTVTRGLNNIIWVWSSGLSLPNTAYYPGSSYVDIIGTDCYNRNFQDDRDYFTQLYNALGAMDATKMCSLTECGAIPNPDLMQSGASPKWLYALSWYGIGAGLTPTVPWDPGQSGAGLSQNSIANDLHNWLAAFMITKDQLPKFSSGSGVNLLPDVGIISPLDDGSGRFVGSFPVICAYASDRDGTISRADVYANGTKVGSVATSPYTFTWNIATPGTYNIQAVAVDNTGASANSQTVRISYNVADLAFNCPLTTSDASNAAAAVDGSYWTNWISAKGATAWNYVDLGSTYTINEVDLSFLWEVFADSYTVNVSTDAVHWNRVATLVDDGTGYQVKATLGSVYSADEYPMKAFNKVTFTPISARYVRFGGVGVMQGQTWGGYNIPQIEVPVALSATNHAPTITASASADQSSFYDYTTNLHVVATDPDHDYLSYSWNVVNGNAANVSFTVNNSLFANNTTINVLAAGAYTIQVTVTDGRGGSATSQITVTQQVINGALILDDCDNQGAGAAGSDPELPASPQAPVSQWAQYCLRCMLQKGIAVQKATLSIYVNTDASGLNASLYSGSTDNWNGTTGPIPTAGALLSTTTIGTIGNAWLTIDVTDFIRSQIQRDGIATFVLAMTDAPDWEVVDSNQFADPTYRPQLSITTVANPLSVSITAPVSGKVYVTAPAAITMTATATDLVGTVSKVAYYNGATLLGTATASPYTVTWSNVPSGTYSIIAVATDSNNVTATSKAVSVRVDAPPVVNLTSPTNGQVYNAVNDITTITLTASASDSDGHVVKVAFYNGLTWIGASTTSPYSFTWSNVGMGIGTYNLHAVAVDNDNVSSTSNIVSIRTNALPSVSLSVTGQSIAPATFTLTATAADKDGTIKKVAIYVGGSLYCTLTSSPYTRVLTGVKAGTYTISAIATDNDNGSTTSKPLIVTIKAPLKSLP